MRLSMGYMEREQELTVISRPSTLTLVEALEQKVTAEEILQLRKELHEVYVSEDVAAYILDIVRATRQADVLVLPSYSEGLPMVVLEAFGSGCGVIATKVGALPEIVTEEVGILVKPGDLDGLRQAVQTYIAMPSEKLHQQKVHNLKAADKFTLDQFVKGVAKICHEV